MTSVGVPNTPPPVAKGHDPSTQARSLSPPRVEQKTITKVEIIRGTIKPHELLGGDPQDFVSVMQSMSRASSVVGDFGRVGVQDPQAPPMLHRIVEAIGHSSAFVLDLASNEDLNLSILLAVNSTSKPSPHCQVPHAICVLAGHMRGNTVEANVCSAEAKPGTLQKGGYTAGVNGLGAEAKTVTLQAGDVMVSDVGQRYASSNEMPCLALLLTKGDPLGGTSLQTLCKISLAKVSQLANNGGGDWQKDADGNKIDWDADGALAVGAMPGQAPAPANAAPSPPVVAHRAFDPKEVLGTNDAFFMASLRTLSTQLPLQVHFEPERISGDSGPGLVRRALDAVAKLDEVKELFDNSGSDNVRLKMRLSGGGKFVHRNRYPRRQAFCLLSGEMTWLLIDSQNNEGKADEFLGAVQNDNWNGYRCPPYPKMLSLEEMSDMQSRLPAGVESKMIKMSAGDVLVFDGRWWHATNYDKQAMSMFLTPGKDMEVAVSEQERRRKMPKQKKLKICTFAEL